MDMADSLNEILKTQLDAIELEADKPLIVSDADEVLLQFVKGLERFLEKRDLVLDISSYNLLGNVKHAGTGKSTDSDMLKSILRDFFAESTAGLEAVPGAAASLNALSDRAQIVILSNVPHAFRDIRQQNLAGHGMPYPVISNKGNKTQALSYLEARIEAPVVFLDDIVDHLQSAKTALRNGVLIHFIADPRLCALMTEEFDGIFRARSWDDARAHIESELAIRGY